MKHFLFKQIVKSRGILLLPEWSHMINASTLGRKGTVPLLILIIPTLYTNMLSLIMHENFTKNLALAKQVQLHRTQYLVGREWTETVKAGSLTGLN